MMNPMYGRMTSLGSKPVQPQQPNPFQKEQPIEEQRTIPTTRGGSVTMPQRKMALQRRLNRTSQPMPQSRGAAGQRGALPPAPTVSN